MYAMRLVLNPPRPTLTTRVAILQDAKGRHVCTFDDVVELLQALPAYDPRYSCRGDLFRENGSGRAYALSWELEEILDNVRTGGRWRVEERLVSDLIAGD
jgi:hypothetical protein